MEDPPRTGTLAHCPNCGHDRLSVRVITWADFKRGRPHSFDPWDIDYAKPVPGAAAVCRNCGFDFTIVEEGSGLPPA